MVLKKGFYPANSGRNASLFISPVFQSIHINLLLLAALLSRLLVADFPPDPLQRPLLCLFNREEVIQLIFATTNDTVSTKAAALQKKKTYYNKIHKAKSGLEGERKKPVNKKLVFLIRFFKGFLISRHDHLSVLSTFVRGMWVGRVAPSLDKSRFSSSVSTISLNWN